MVRSRTTRLETDKLGRTLEPRAYDEGGAGRGRVGGGPAGGPLAELEEAFPRVGLLLARIEVFTSSI